MVFKITNHINTRYQRQTSFIMKTVCLAALPSILVEFWFFSWGILFQIFIGCVSALVFEALVLKIRKIQVIHTLSDYSALLTGLLLAVSIPPLSPWWMIALGNFFAIIIAKQFYGGLGHNIFNPAMIGYVVLLTSFPVQMNNWLPSYEVAAKVPSFTDSLQAVFNRKIHSNNDLSILYMRIDGVSQATPLDKLKVLQGTKYILTHTKNYGIYNDILSDLMFDNWKYVNFSWLLGGLFLIWKRIIRWHIPISFLITLTFCATINWIVSPNSLVSPKVHLLYGATMLGAFFILTDPVTTSTTSMGRLIFGAIAGLLVWLIRTFGSYPDGIAFAVLLANITVPIIDHYIRPRTYGH